MYKRPIRLIRETELFAANFCRLRSAVHCFSELFNAISQDSSCDFNLPYATLASIDLLRSSVSYYINRTDSY